MMRTIVKAALVAFGLSATPALAQNLVTNGSFESDPLAPGAYRDMLVGSSDLPGWTIIGVPGTHISQVEQGYPGNPGYSFPAQDGAQWLDLAGYSDNAADGVSQTIATAVGSTYMFSFWLGNVSGGAFGSQTLVNYSFDGGSTNFACLNTASTQTLSWLQCSQTFTATSTSAILRILNADPQSDFSSAIDNVSFVEVRGPGGAVPEPAAWGMLLGGFGIAGAAMRRRSWAAKAARAGAVVRFPKPLAI